MDNIPHPRHIFMKNIFMPLICHHPLAPEATIKVPGRGNLDHEQFVTSSISNTLRTKTDLLPECVVRNKVFLNYSDIW